MFSSKFPPLHNKNNNMHYSVLHLTASLHIMLRYSNWLFLLHSKLYYLSCNLKYNITVTASKAYSAHKLEGRSKAPVFLAKAATIGTSGGYSGNFLKLSIPQWLACKLVPIWHDFMSGWSNTVLVPCWHHGILYCL